MVTSISSSYSNSISYASPQSIPQDETFNKLSKELGSDGKTITKEQLENYVKSSQKSTSETVDKSQLEFVNKLLKNWNTISGGGKSITQSDLAFSISYLKSQEDNSNNNALISNDDFENEYTPFYDNGTTSVTTSFDILAAKLGACDDKVTKEQLMAYLQTLSSSQNPHKNTREITFIKNLIAKFDTLSGGEKYITSFNGINDPQDYTTITKEQVTPPIDIRI